MDLDRLSAYEWAQAIREKRLNVAEGFRWCQERLQIAEPVHHALLGTAPETTRLAQELDEICHHGKELGPLCGVPIVLKNNIAHKGWPLTCGSKILQNFKSTFHATVVERLLQAHGLPFAYANLDEFAMGASTENSAYGPTKNPFQPEHVPGGSSGGSAVAVAAGYAPLALGSETGGSVRQPAAFCGIFGFKPTYGRLSRYGLVAFASSLDHIGIFGRSSMDLGLAYDVMAGADPCDSTSLALSVEPTLPHIRDGVKGLRIGLVRASFQDDVDAQIQAAVKDAARAFENAGARVEETELPLKEVAVPTYYLLNTAEASSNLARFDGVRYGFRSPQSKDLQALYDRSREQGFGAEVKRRILLGTFCLSAGYQDEYFHTAQQARTQLRIEYGKLFNEFDLLLSPTTPTPAFRLGEKKQDPVAMYLCDVFTCAANLTGIPAVNVPAGLGDNGLPLGVQLMSGAYQESRLLRGAYILEAALGGCPHIPAERVKSWEHGT